MNVLSIELLMCYALLANIPEDMSPYLVVRSTIVGTCVCDSILISIASFGC